MLVTTCCTSFIVGQEMIEYDGGGGWSGKEEEGRRRSGWKSIFPATDSRISRR